MAPDFGKALAVFGVLCALAGVVVWHVVAFLLAHVTIGWAP